MSSWQQTVRVAVNAFGVPYDLVTPVQVEEEVVKETFSQRAPRMFMEIREERTEPIGALERAMIAAKQDIFVGEECVVVERAGL